MLTPLLLAACLSLSLLQQGDDKTNVPNAPAAAPTPQAPAGDPDWLVIKRFGKAGDPGAYLAWFDKRSGSLISLRLLDHFVTHKAGHKPIDERQDEDYQTIVYGGPNTGYLLREEAEGQPVFAASLLGSSDNPSAQWTSTPVDGGVRFEFASGGYVLSKTFTHRPGYRGLQLVLELKNDSGTATAANLGLMMYGPVVVNPAENSSLLGNPAVAIGTAGVPGATPAVVVAPGQLVTQPLLTTESTPLVMAGSTDRYFASFLSPLDDAARKAVLAVTVDSLPQADHPLIGKAHSAPRLNFRLRLPVPAKDQSTRATFALYFGPKSFTAFAEQEEHARYLPILDKDLEPPCCGSFTTIPGGLFMAKLLVKLLTFFHGIVHNWGISIMLLTILVRGLLAPVNFHMQKSMRAYSTKMAKVQPLMAKMKEKYADDQKQYQAEMQKFMREHKLMPPIGGCLPMFATMPIYIGLFSALRTAYDLRQQPYLWITDLSQPDALFALPFWPGLFNLLPLLWLGMFIFMQLRMPLPTDPQQRQMQMMMRFMPLLFGVMLYNYASGLMVYMVTSMIWSLIESSITKKILGPIDPNVQAMAPTPTF